MPGLWLVSRFILVSSVALRVRDDAIHNGVNAAARRTIVDDHRDWPLTGLLGWMRYNNIPPH